MSGRIWSVVLAGVMLLVSGCTGGGKQELSLDQQVKKAHAETDSGRKARMLAGLGEKQLKAGDVLAGEATLSGAATAAAEVEEPDSRANTLIFVGQAMGRAGKLNEAKKALREAAKALESVQDAGPKALALAELGTAAGVYLKNADAAVGHLQNAELAAEKVELAAMKAAAYGKIMVAYERSERPAEAKATLGKAMEFITALTAPREKVDCLAEMGDALAKSKKPDEATAVFGDANKIADAIKEDDARGYAFLSLGKKLKLAGRPEEGRKALSKADDAAQKIKDTSIKGPLLADIQAARK